MAFYFDETYYLNTKLAQLKAINYPDADAMTTSELKEIFAVNGMTPQDHYLLYGHLENVNPNPYFNEVEYLTTKLKALQEKPSEAPADWHGTTIEELRDYMAERGLTPVEHYARYGAFETRGDGTLLNPSNAFDANAYFQAKLYELQRTDYPGAESMTLAELVKFFQDQGLTPVDHYALYGATEATDNNIMMVQTVPVVQRVANDPARTQFGENVPSNYNPATKGPAAAGTEAHAVIKPADMGQMVPTTLSPAVQSPATPVKVPGQPGYEAPPSNIVDTNSQPVIAPTTTGDGSAVTDNWLILNLSQTGANGSTPALVVSESGQILGQLDVMVTPSGGDLPPTVTVPSDSTTSNLAPANPNNVPPNMPIGPDDNVTPDNPEPGPNPDPEPNPEPVVTQVTASVANNTLTISGAAEGAVTVVLNANGATSVSVAGMTSPIIDGTNTGITAVDVSGVTGQNVAIQADSQSTPLTVSVTGQTGAQTTTVNGGTAADTVTVISGNVNVATEGGADTVTLDANSAGTTNLGADNDTLNVQGTVGAATLDGGEGTDILVADGNADITDVASLTNFEKIAFSGNGSSFTMDASQLTGITGVTGTSGADTLNINMATSGTVDVSAVDFTDWTAGEDKTVITTSAAGGDTITLSASESDTVNFTVSGSGTPAADTVNDFTFGATNAGGDVIAFSEVTGLRGMKYQKVAAPGFMLGASTGFVVYTGDVVNDQTAAQRIVEGLTVVAANDVIYFLSSNDTNATLYRATYTAATTADLEEIATFNGVTTANLDNVVADNLDGFTFDNGQFTATVSAATNTLILSGAATDAVTVTLDSLGVATVTEGSTPVSVDGGVNAGIQKVNVASVTGNDVSIEAANSAEPLNVNVTGQIEERTTTVIGSSGNDSITVSSGNVNVYAETRDDVVTVGTGYAGTVDFSTGDDTLDISGVIGAATFIGTTSLATMRLKASADLTAANLIDFDALAFIHNGQTTLDIGSRPFATITRLTGMSGQDDTLNIHMPTGGGALDLSRITLTTWDGNDTINVIGSDNADIITLGMVWDSTNKLTVTGGKGDDIITLGSGQDTVIFADTAADNGQDTITDFTVGANNDVLDFFGGSTAAVTTNFGTAIDMTNGNATAITNNEVVRVTNTAGTLASSQITATSSQANMLTVADNATVVALVATDTGVANFKVYEITDTDASGAQNYQVTLMGTVTLTTGEIFNDLVAGNIA